MKILLVCSAGMSTSLFVKKMRNEALNRSIDVEITAKPIDEIEDIVGDYDLLLIAPQIKYKESYIKKLVENAGKVYSLIPPMMYGMIDGKGALELALKIYSNQLKVNK